MICLNEASICKTRTRTVINSLCHHVKNRLVFSVVYTLFRIQKFNSQLSLLIRSLQK